MSSASTDPGAASVAEIEREVDRGRGQIAETIDALQSKVSVNGLVDEVVKAFSEHGGEVSRTLGRSVRDNPLPLLLTGVGLAWLMASSSGGGQAGSHADPEWDRMERMRRGGSNGDLPKPHATYAPSDGDEGYTIPAAGDAGAHAYGEDGEDSGGMAGSVLRSGRDAGAAARDKMAELGGRAQDAWSEAGDRVSDAGSRLSDASHRARDWGAQRSQGMRSSVSSALEEQPLVFGALALAVGAALGGALPRTRVEDDLMGAQADRLKASATDVLVAEGEKASSVAGAVADEAMRIYDEAAGELSQHVPDGAALVDKAKHAAMGATDRLRTVAEQEAENQQLMSTKPAEPQDAEPR